MEHLRGISMKRLHVVAAIGTALAPICAILETKREMARASKAAAWILKDMEMAQARPKQGKTVQALLLQPHQRGSPGLARRLFDDERSTVRPRKPFSIHRRRAPMATTTSRSRE